MEPQDLKEVVAEIHATPLKAVVAVTGGASQAVGELLCVPGASGTVLEVTVPYSRESLIDLIGSEPAQYVCTDTALRMARAAYERAVRLSQPGDPVVGVAATCALTSEPPKRGAHRFEVAAYTGTDVYTYSVTLEKGVRDRKGEDAVAGHAVLQVLADAAEVPCDVLPRTLQAAGFDESATSAHEPLEEALDAVLGGRERLVEFGRGGSVLRGATRARVALPGSFNPLHSGHRALLEAAAALRPDAQLCYELALTNADKGTLPKEEAHRRIGQVLEEGGHPIVCTNEPLYLGKAALMPNTTFVVGADTAVRLVMPKYYSNSRDRMVAALAAIQQHGCSFLVAGRLAKDGAFEELSNVEVPEGLEHLFQAIPDFRQDISSTELRGGSKSAMVLAVQDIDVRGGEAGRAEFATPITLTHTPTNSTLSFTLPKLGNSYHGFDAFIGPIYHEKGDKSAWVEQVTTDAESTILRLCCEVHYAAWTERFTAYRVTRRFELKNDRLEWLGETESERIPEN